MRRLAVLVLALTAALPAVPARAGFSGNICSLVAAKQVATIVGDSSTGKYGCNPQKSVNTPAGVMFNATSGPSKPELGGSLTVQVIKYANPKVESLVRAHFTSTMKPLAHIGDWAYSHTSISPVVGGTAVTEQVVFASHGYGVLVLVRSQLAKSVNQPALKALAAAIAKQL